MASTPESREDKDTKTVKRRKSAANGEEDTKKPFFQLSPFEPAGKFRTRESMDIHYHLEPRKKWTEMTRYNSFVRKFIYFIFTW